MTEMEEPTAKLKRPSRPSNGSRTPSNAAAPSRRRSARSTSRPSRRTSPRLVEEGGKALAAYLKPREEGKIKDETADSIADVVKTLGQVAEYWLSDPQRAVEAADRASAAPISICGRVAVKRMAGEPAEPVVDARPEGQALRRSGMVEEPVLRFPQAGLSAHRAVGRASWCATPRLDQHTRQKAEFYVKQIANAISPSNFVLTNPELLRETLAAERREPRARHAHAGRGHRGRARQSARSASRTPASSRSATISRSRPAR